MSTEKFHDLPEVSMDYCGMIILRSVLGQPRDQFVHGRNIVSLAGLILFGPPPNLPAHVIS